MTRILSAMVLAGGDDGAMRGTRPKPLHRLCGRPLVSYVLDALRGRRVDRVVVVVDGESDRVTKVIGGTVEGLAPDVVERTIGRGSGDATAAGLTAFATDELDDDDADLLLLPGDAPLLRPSTISMLVDEHRASGADATILTVPLRPGRGTRRPRRGRDGRVTDLVVAPDADDESVVADVAATDVMCVRRSLIGPALRRVADAGLTVDYELSGLVPVLHQAGYRVELAAADSGEDLVRVHDRVELAAAEAELRRRINRRWMHQGVTIVDPASTYIDRTVELAPDVTIFPSTMLQGATVVEDGAEIGPDTRLVDCHVGPGAKVEKTTATGANIGADARVGPFAALGPGADVAPGFETGPFHQAG
ncbi:MAG: NTP transferase domain-containing protein [Actinomycetota bacterium]